MRLLVTLIRLVPLCTEALCFPENNRSGPCQDEEPRLAKTCAGRTSGGTAGGRGTLEVCAHCSLLSSRNVHHPRPHVRASISSYVVNSGQPPQLGERGQTVYLSTLITLLLSVRPASVPGWDTFPSIPSSAFARSPCPRGCWFLPLMAGCSLLLPVYCLLLLLVVVYQETFFFFIFKQSKHLLSMQRWFREFIWRREGTAGQGASGTDCLCLRPWLIFSLLGYFSS